MPTLIPGSVAKQSFLLRSHGSYRVGILKDTCIIFLFPQKPWHPLLQIPTPRNSRFKIKRFAYSNYRTHANSASGYYFHTRHLGGLVIEFSARDLLLEKVFYFDGKNYGQGASIIQSLTPFWAEINQAHIYNFGAGQRKWCTYVYNFGAGRKTTRPMARWPGLQWRQ